MIRIVDKSNTTHRGNPDFRIEVNGELFTTPEGISSYWTEADALRACAKYFGVLPE